MRVGVVGLGKLGLPVAYAMASRGLDVYGFDPEVDGPPAPLSHEQGLVEAVEQAGDRMRFVDLSTVVEHCDVVFVAVQTPHGPEFEGVTPLTEDRADFDYSYLRDAAKDIVFEAFRQKRRLTLAVVSTVLPGTLEREVRPLLGTHHRLVYNPSFIAMGTTIKDFLDPEFVLLGGEYEARLAVLEIYAEIARGSFPRTVETTIENAELIKVAYNTMISLKIAFANTLMEIAHKTGCDVDEVTGALKLADRRLTSGAYLDGGMGDGGACHPRDNIALSWLTDELILSHDLFGDVMLCREHQARWLAELMLDTAYDLNPEGQSLGILGVAYKPTSAITTGSAARLVENMLIEDGHEVDVYDPHVQGCDDASVLDEPHVWLVGCKHPELPQWKFPAGSVVIDPFRYMPDQEGVAVVRLGEAAGRRRGVSAPVNGDGPDRQRVA